MILEKLEHLYSKFKEYRNSNGFNEDNFKEFFKLNAHKKEKIIKSALDEFNLKNYNDASTNSIIKKANIGKGMLFYYFKSKENLFKFLIYYCLDKFFFLLKEELEKVNFLSNISFEEKLFIISKIKIQIYKKNRNISDFLIKYFSNPPENLKDFIFGLYNFLVFFSPDFIIDEEISGKIKDEFDRNKVKELILFLIKGYEEKLFLEIKSFPDKEINYEDKAKEFIEYLSILKKGFQK